MVKKQKRLYRPRKKFKFELLLFISSLLFFIFAVRNSEYFLQSSANARMKLTAEFNTQEADVDSASGLPQLSGGRNLSVDDEAENLTFPYIGESTILPGEINLLLKKYPITNITIKADAESDEPNVTIKNETKYKPDLSALLKAGPSLSLVKNKPQVLILHTHTSEAYSPDGKDTYLPDDTDRTLDKRYNIVQVGAEIAKALTKKGIRVIHLEDVFDYPTYTGSYNKSLAAVQAQLKKYPSIKVVLDIHRDAMITSEGVKYKTVSEINGKEAAQIMFVCGTDAGGLAFRNWRQNLAFVTAMQQLMLKKYPTLMRPINLRAARFNQHVTSCAALVEIGTCGNTLEEAVYSASLFGDALGDMLKKYIK